jgi:ribosome biogenesis GTPase
VVAADRDALRAWTEQGDTEVIIQRGFRRSLATRAEFPVVGDWLALEPVAAGQAALRALLPRATRFVRGEQRGGGEVFEQVLAANVDTVVIVAALTRDLNLRRLERYLALAWSSGADPVVLLNKADLCDDVPARLGEVRAIATGAPVLVASALRAEGLEALAAWTGPGRTAVLLGSSGVGKSTITNLLLGEHRQLVRDVREDDSRGRHTTTTRERCSGYPTAPCSSTLRACVPWACGTRTTASTARSRTSRSSRPAAGSRTAPTRWSLAARWLPRSPRVSSPPTGFGHAASSSASWGS